MTKPVPPKNFSPQAATGDFAAAEDSVSRGDGIAVDGAVFRGDGIAAWRKIAEETAWKDYAAASSEAAELMKLAQKVS